MSQILDEGAGELGQPLSSSDRLRALLFLVEKKLEQKVRLQRNVYVVLAVLIAMSLALMAGSGEALAHGRLLGTGGNGASRSVLIEEGWAWTLAFLLAPFVMSFLQYLWITFAQICYRSLDEVDALLETSDFEEFRPILHREMLEDDGSLLSQLHDMLTVEYGLSSTLFRVAGLACTLLPVVAQAIVSTVTTALLWRDNVGIAIGLAMFYAMALMLALVKTWGLYRFVRRMK